MGVRTLISWAHHTFNPWWGCARISEGCRYCYAEAFDLRVAGRGKGHWGPRAPHRRFGDKHWAEPLKWNAEAKAAGERRRVFCASMADVFEGRREDGPDRTRLWRLIAATPWLDWLLLTKRPHNMLRLAPADWAHGWPHNVWAGCTVENTAAIKRLAQLREVPAVLRFVSAEPLLEDLGSNVDFAGAGVGWVIVGGESGSRARPFAVNWAASLLLTCRAQGVPFFLKQFGAVAEVQSFSTGRRSSRLVLADSKGGDLEELKRVMPGLAVRELPRVELLRAAS